jgi:hypothetical protein
MTPRAGAAPRPRGGPAGGLVRTRRRLLAAAVAAGLSVAATAAADPCPAPPGFAAGDRIASEGVVVLYRAVPAPIEIGRHFAVEAIVCTPPPGPRATGLRVDAGMPEHRHGMNYRARVSATGDGRYLAEGLLFHMPGRWQLIFDVERGARSDRLAADLVLE